MIEWVRSGFSAFYAASPLIAIGSFAAVWILLGVTIFFWLKGGGGDVPHRDAPGPPAQDQQIVNSPGAASYQAGRDLTIINPQPHAPPPAAAPHNLIRNGGFEAGSESWGTGYLEDSIRNSHYPEDFKRLPYVVGDKPNTPTDSSGALDTAFRHSGLASFRFDHRHPRTNHHYGSLAQRVHGLSPHTYYVVRFWVRATNAPVKAFFVTTDLRWAQRTYVPTGTYDWREWKHEFNTGPDDYVDVRFVVEAPCTVWIDDVSLTPLAPTGGTAGARPTP